MRLTDDDELYRVDETYLGPPGTYIAVMKHRAIFVWIVIGPLSLFLLRRTGLDLHWAIWVFAIYLTWWISQYIADHIGFERELGHLLTMLKNDLTARRVKK